MTPINEEWLPKDARLLPKEGEEQATLFSGGKRNKKEAGRFKAEGVKSGVPDIMLPVARDGYHGLFIELKRLKGGRVEKEQLEWHDKLRAQGYQVVVCRGWQAAAQEITGYLERAQ